MDAGPSMEYGTTDGHGNRGRIQRRRVVSSSSSSVCTLSRKQRAALSPQRSPSRILTEARRPTRRDGSTARAGVPVGAHAALPAAVSTRVGPRESGQRQEAVPQLWTPRSKVAELEPPPEGGHSRDRTGRRDGSDIATLGQYRGQYALTDQLTPSPRVQLALAGETQLVIGFLDSLARPRRVGATGSSSSWTD